MKKIIIIFFIPAFFAVGCLGAYAHGLNLDEVYQKLEVKEPTLLPGNAFYFLKNISRGMRLFFTFDQVKSTELELRFADNKLAEFSKLSLQKATSQDTLNEALQNYLESQKKLQEKLDALQGKNKNTDKLLEKLADRVIKHEELFEELKETKKEDDIKKIEEASKEILTGVKKALKLDEKKLKETFKKRIKEDKNLTGFKILTNIVDSDSDKELEEILKDIEKEVLEDPDSAKDAAEELLGESLEEIKESEEKVGNTNLDARGGDESRRLLKDANKHWGFARSAFEQNNFTATEEHADHVKKFLSDLDAVLMYKKKVDDLSDCGPRPGAPGNWICQGGRWKLTNKENIVCIQLYNPVCGIDGKTYSNECFAKTAGVGIKHKGECQTKVENPGLGPPKIQEFRVEVDDNGFYPINIDNKPYITNTLGVARGAKVKITFLVRSSNTYYGGLDFRSSKFKTESINPGGSTTIEFVADDSFTITSYWPVSEIKKADLLIVVK